MKTSEGGMDRNQLLLDCEERIGRGLSSFVDLGEALRLIKEMELYRPSYKHFDEYCQGRWDMNRNWVREVISLAKIAREFGHATVAPSTQSQLMTLATAKSKEKRQMVWDRAVSRAGGGQPTPYQIAMAKVVVDQHTRSRPGTGVKFVDDIDVMADKLVEHFSERQIHELVSGLMNRLTRRHSEAAGLAAD